MRRIMMDATYGVEGLAYLRIVEPHYIVNVIDILRVSPRMGDVFALRRVFPHWFRTDVDLPVVLVRNATVELGVSLLVVQGQVEGSVDLMSVGEDILLNHQFDLRAVRLGRRAELKTRGFVTRDWVVAVFPDRPTVSVDVGEVSEDSVDWVARDLPDLSHVAIIADVCPETLPSLPGYCFMHHIPMFRRGDLVQKIGRDPVCADFAVACEGFYLPPAQLANIEAVRTVHGWHLQEGEGSLVKLDSDEVVDVVLDKPEAWRGFVTDAQAELLSQLARPVTFLDVDLCRSVSDGNRFWEWASGLVHDADAWYLIQHLGKLPCWAGKILPSDLIGRAGIGPVSITGIRVAISGIEEVKYVCRGIYRYKVRVCGGRAWQMLVDGKKVGFTSGEFRHLAPNICRGESLEDEEYYPKVIGNFSGYIEESSLDHFICIDSDVGVDLQFPLFLRFREWYMDWKESPGDKYQVCGDWHDLDVPDGVVYILFFDEYHEQESRRILGIGDDSSKFKFYRYGQFDDTRFDHVWLFRVQNYRYFYDFEAMCKCVRMARLTFRYIRKSGVSDRFVELVGDEADKLVCAESLSYGFIDRYDSDLKIC